MDAEVLLTLSSFCRVRMQGRPVFSTGSRSLVGDVCTFVKHLECSRGEQTATALAFFKVVSHASSEAETIQQQLIGTWLVCSLLVERIADAWRLYWECERTRGVLRLLFSENYFGVGKCNSSVLGSRSLAPVAAKRQNGNLASAGFFPASEKTFRKAIRVLDTADGCCATAHDDVDSKAPAFEFFLPNCSESKDVIVFCTQMIQKRKYFRSCCVRRFDDCCETNDLEACLKASGVHVVFVQQSIHKKLKEAFIKLKVLFLERLGRSIVDASEKALRWKVFESFSDWFFFLRAKSSQKVWRCWATTTQHPFGLTLRLHIRGCLENAGKSTASIKHATWSALNEPVNPEVNEVCEAKWFRAGGDVGALLLRNIFIATLLCRCAETAGNDGGENAVWMANYKTAMRTLDTVCQLCRLLM
ncbi:hypothetical protein LSCM4_04317 [Leishmania orientalis]|uniref:Uncharacterized protein n=1 Tax=Leishmania orientalis TaxID=2249476 RepID=A0A836KRN9_9TRYP|nr:hypothetical protein LSCM4_04317 [Leishmania orientalis]